MPDKMNQQINGIVQGIIGYLKPIAHSKPPANWLLCDGAQLAINDYPALFAVIGAQFGGDGVATFQLPNLSGEHHFAICCDGYFPQIGAPLTDWALCSDEIEETVQMRTHAFREAYVQGHDPFHRHRHDSELDPDWLSMQVQTMNDAYARGDEPLYRHPHMSEIDKAWLERQVQVMIDAHAQGHDPFDKHPHVSELDPDWLERQAQVLKDAYAQGRDPLHRHQQASQIDPVWLERQAQLLQDVYAQGRDPLHRHLPSDHYDADWLERQAQVLKDGYAQGRNPLHQHQHGDDLDPNWLKMQAQVLHDAYEQDADPLHRHWHGDHLDDDWLEALTQPMLAKLSSTAVEPIESFDDLQLIEGIGPKTAVVLREANIVTFTQLAAVTIDALRQTLRQASIRANPSTWPEQAQLAATGRWDELKRLQDNLIGGRRP